MTEARIAESKERAKGPLKITTTVAFGSTWLTPHMKEFRDLYPEIELSLVLVDTELDLSMRAADCAVRFPPPRQPDLIQRPLKRICSRIYASPDYLSEYGIQAETADLDRPPLPVHRTDPPPPPPTPTKLL